ncbi:ATP phosphoribosyltransferase regulatory subunit [Qingshengfaniella alkalisoli]|uniref:Histidine--tRNA ligase n=1 Tax=Qingshengfaniella alkalisoli TaxID=2599296 RepID=A0A5B8IX60_9RHOB|nr:ATP phosphoribosyltransferase regulatory subunit [Qingshengfaniella alkalisoli]QDY70183.1 ATP phosphoribosyltransferase regulatory subunit [Qingshengfaniella alkalisoli]
MLPPAAVRAEAARLRAYFEGTGAVAVEAPILLPADTLLDLYGEDIRGRAYVTHDPLRGEMMLRPDFTVPVVSEHMTNGAEPARYTYAGEVFRKQEIDPERPSEYLQVGLEIFDGTDPARADAEVFTLFRDVLDPCHLRAATGDIGILTAAVHGLTTSDPRRAALLRHIWRPRRFRALLDRFAGRGKLSSHRAELLARLSAGHDPLSDGTPLVGLRGEDEIRQRLTLLRADAAEANLPAAEVELLDEILGLKDKAPVVLENLRDLAVDMPALADAVQRLEARLDAMSARGINVGDLDFEASFGRTTLEYYDGFVFGFYSVTRPDLPPVATGGRYDALTRVLGGGRSIPAVGGVIRPEMLLTLGCSGDVK